VGARFQSRLKPLLQSHHASGSYPISSISGRIVGRIRSDRLGVVLAPLLRFGLPLTMLVGCRLAQRACRSAVNGMRAARRHPGTSQRAARRCPRSAGESTAPAEWPSSRPARGGSRTPLEGTGLLQAGAVVLLPARREEKGPLPNSPPLIATGSGTARRNASARSGHRHAPCASRPSSN